MSNVSKSEPPATISRDMVYALITAERCHQKDKGFTHPHEVGAWITVLQQKLTDAVAAWTKNGGDALAIMEIVQIAAVAVACVESHGGKLLREFLPTTDAAFEERINPVRFGYWKRGAAACNLEY